MSGRDHLEHLDELGQPQLSKVISGVEFQNKSDSNKIDENLDSISAYVT